MSLREAALRLKSAWETFARTVKLPAACLYCGGRRIWWNGKRLRSASVQTEDGNVHLIRVPCRRVKCGDQACRRSWTLRPPGLAPHRHYQLCIVARAASIYLYDPGTSQVTIAQEHQCSERTVGRWLRWLGQLADPAVLQRKILETTGAPVLVPHREVANLTGKARHADRQEVLTRAERVLAAFEVWGMALGLVPPGLRAILERVLANRPGIATYRHPLIPEFAR